MAKADHEARPALPRCALRHDGREIAGRLLRARSYGGRSRGTPVAGVARLPNTPFEGDAVRRSDTF